MDDRVGFIYISMCNKTRKPSLSVAEVHLKRLIAGIGSYVLGFQITMDKYRDRRYQSHED